MERIAVDAMGGDHAPHEIIAGAIRGARRAQVALLLVGPPEIIETELAKHAANGLDVTIVPAEEVIAMTEQPLAAVRHKKRASIVVATELVRDGIADAVVTMGHTGAATISALFILGTIEGIERPAACLHQYFGIGPRTCLIDGGANTEVRPEQLLQFGVMGSVFAERVLGIPRPTVGLLSNGEEDNKGNQVNRAAFPLFKASRLNFIGNIEGRDIPMGRANVVVSDGFVGNVVIKLTEGLTEWWLHAVETELSKALPESTMRKAVRPALARLRRRNDYAEYGAGLLLGVNGLCVIGHGRSKAKAVVNAIRLAKSLAQADVVGTIRDGWLAIANS